jgi:hypothetical protein
LGNLGLRIHKPIDVLILANRYQFISEHGRVPVRFVVDHLDLDSLGFATVLHKLGCLRLAYCWKFVVDGEGEA